jgi:hypothetical protein
MDCWRRSSWYTARRCGAMAGSVAEDPSSGMCTMSSRAIDDPRLRTITWREGSGRRGSNSRHSAWKADALPLSYARTGCENIADPIQIVRNCVTIPAKPFARKVVTIRPPRRPVGEAGRVRRVDDPAISGRGNRRQRGRFPSSVCPVSLIRNQSPSGVRNPTQ